MEKSESKYLNKLTDQELIENFFVSLSEGDPDDIKSAIYSILKRFGATNISQKTNIPITALYDICKDDSNPSLDKICKIISYLRNQEQVL